MDWSPVVMECLIEERLAEARAAAAQRGLLRPRPLAGQRRGPTLLARLAEIAGRLLRSRRVEAPASATVRPEDCRERAA